MPRGDKTKYTDKQIRKADHIIESYESRGVLEVEAERSGAGILAAIIVSLIYFGRDGFIPVALAILLSFVLAPHSADATRLAYSARLSINSVVLLAFLAMFAVGGVIAAQVTQLAGDLPHYQSTILAKIKSHRATTRLIAHSNAPRKCLRSLAESSMSRWMHVILPRQ